MSTFVPPDAGPELGENDVMDVAGRTASSNDAALIKPAPHVFDGAAESQTPPGKDVAYAGFVISASTCAGVSAGLRDSMRATTPAT